jgi:hypothetical protein
MVTMMVITILSAGLLYWFYQSIVVDNLPKKNYAIAAKLFAEQDYLRALEFLKATPTARDEALQAQLTELLKEVENKLAVQEARETRARRQREFAAAVKAWKADFEKIDQITKNVAQRKSLLANLRQRLEAYERKYDAASEQTTLNELKAKLDPQP